MTYSAHQAANLSGLSYRQLDYWCRIKLIRPSIREGHAGHSLGRVFSFADLVALRILRELVYARSKPHPRTRVIVEVIQSETRWEDRYLVIAGEDIWILNREELKGLWTFGTRQKIAIVVPLEPEYRALLDLGAVGWSA